MPKAATLRCYLMLNLLCGLPKVYSMVAANDMRGVMRSPDFLNEDTKTRKSINRDLPRKKIALDEIKIRKSRDEDLSTISTLLAHAITVDNYGDTGESPFQALNNWKINTERLKIKANVRKQMQERLDAIKEGQFTIPHIYPYIYGTDNTEEHTPQSALLSSSSEFVSAMWSHEKFRTKVERAVKLSSERSAWEGHNFYCAPEDPCLFQHAMISVKSKKTSEVIGFTEVAMLRSPHNDLYSMDSSDVSQTVRYTPTITNLVICPSQRRKGVASRLVKAAARYVRSQWKSSSTLGLYVDNCNVNALSLYAKEGFAVVGKSDENPNQSYMEYQLRKTSFQ